MLNFVGQVNYYGDIIQKSKGVKKIQRGKQISQLINLPEFICGLCNSLSIYFCRNQDLIFLKHSGLWNTVWLMHSSQNAAINF